MSLEPIPLQIGGEFVRSPQHAEGLDPSRPHQVAYRYALADSTHVDPALDVAREAQQVWGSHSIAVRGAVLLEVAAELARRRGDLIGSMLLDSAKTVAEADREVSEDLDFARYYAQALDLGGEGAHCSMTTLRRA